MSSQSEWKIVQRRVSSREHPLFFTPSEWDAIEAATARIIPTDHQPGAREAEVVRFIDQFLSGVGYIYADPRGDGFLELAGPEAEAWRQRISQRQLLYRDGVSALNSLAQACFGRVFAVLSPEEQDAVLENLSGQRKPGAFTPPGRDTSQVQERPVADGAAPPTNQPITDEGLDFFAMLVLHTRQGFYADPAYGGNADRVGWAVIGFPGPSSLAATRDGTFTTAAYLD